MHRITAKDLSVFLNCSIRTAYRKIDKIKDDFGVKDRNGAFVILSEVSRWLRVPKEEFINAIKQKK